eukprot:TRINITY_DN7294_c0_g1_i1.p1 TRINITY_DN7294_c0_g1~~TRINITY_DN7294_c0_g1_i1.p1  ORF type:complete len:1209 (-),score=177.78 TRINITY_DN7294_c0_g1_i1:267-3788(-)
MPPEAAAVRPAELQAEKAEEGSLEADSDCFSSVVPVPSQVGPSNLMNEIFFPREDGPANIEIAEPRQSEETDEFSDLLDSVASQVSGISQVFPSRRHSTSSQRRMSNIGSVGGRRTSTPSQASQEQRRRVSEVLPLDFGLRPDSLSMPMQRRSSRAGVKPAEMAAAAARCSATKAEEKEILGTLENIRSGQVQLLLVHDSLERSLKQGLSRLESLLLGKPDSFTSSHVAPRPLQEVQKDMLGSLQVTGSESEESLRPVSLDAQTIADGAQMPSAAAKPVMRQQPSLEVPAVANVDIGERRKSGNSVHSMIPPLDDEKQEAPVAKLRYEESLSESSSGDDEPEEWPTLVQCRKGGEQRTRASVRRQSGLVTQRTSENQEVDNEMDYHGLKKHRVKDKFYSIDPNSRMRTGIDVLSLLALMHDMMVIPWMVAWDMNLETSVRDTLILTTIFWTADIGISFLTGFYDDGMIERRLVVIAHRYMRGWFLIDVTLVIFDWTSIISAALDSGESSEAVGLKVLRSLKATKFLRIFGLIRMIRLSRLFEEVLDRTLAGAFRAAFDIIKLLVMLLWLSHLTTCMWFLLGSSYTGDTEAVWFDSVQYLPVGTEFRYANRIYQYFTSFHFALSQVTANGVEMLSPLNSVERSFNIVCLIFGLFFSSHVVSTFSSAMMNLEMANQHKNHRLRQLKQLLTQSAVDSALAIRVTRQVKERMNSTKLLTEQDVSALELLSASLLKELRYAMHGPLLIRHPLMRLLWNVDVNAVAEICDRAMHLLLIPAGDALFHAQDEASKMYILEAGLMTYTLRETMNFEVSSGSYLSEAALWCIWNHRGDAVAVADCKVLFLDAEAMLEALGKYDHPRQLALAYGRRFHSHLQAAYPPSAPYPDDLQVAFTDYSDIVMAMSSREQQLIADISLNYQLQQRRGGPRLTDEVLAELRQEVMDGKSFIIQDEDGQAERAVNLIVIELQQAGKIMAQIGKFQDGELIMEFQRPGGKQRRNELPGQALARIIFKERLAAVRDYIDLVNVDRETVLKDSARYGLRTKYVKTIHYATLDGAFKLESEYEEVLSPLTSSEQPLRITKRSIHDPRLSHISSQTFEARELPAHLHGLDSVAFRLGDTLCMFFEKEDWDYWNAGNGKDLLDIYRRKLEESRQGPGPVRSSALSGLTRPSGFGHSSQ